MPKLDNYRQFDGLHWETGSICNHLAHRGVKAPHSGEPYTEALLLGVSGGAAMGYFTFAYEGYDPQARVLTRNTFDPTDTLLARLGVVQTVRRTGSPDKAVANLLDSLEEGLPPIVWADMFSLPYNALPYHEGMWMMFPIVVYGFEEGARTVWIADRSRVPLTVTTSELAAARSRVKKAKNRILTLEPPNPDKLPEAVREGIWSCIKLYTEGPPKGSKSNFGFAAYDRWADLLVKPKLRMSWEREFPPGARMYAGLKSAFDDIALFGKDGNAERDTYADFLDESALILCKPDLKDAANQFRTSAWAWHDLGIALLPDEVPQFKETRELMTRRHRLFLDQGTAALADMQQIDAQLEALKAQISADFPLDGAEVDAMRETLREHILGISAIEHPAVAVLIEAMNAS